MIAASLNKYLSAEMAALIERLLVQAVDPLPELKTEVECLGWIVAYTQQHWLRSPGTERWELVASEPSNTAVLELLNNSALIVEQPPLQSHYDHVLLMSAFESVFLRRIDYFSRLVQGGLSFGKVVLLGGERRLDPLHETAAIQWLGPDAREIEMLAHHAQRMSEREDHIAGLEFIQCSTAYVADAAGGLRRPNTDDTVVRWSEQMYEGGSVLCLSNQPFVHYQTSVVRSVLGPQTVVHGAGPATEPDTLNLQIVFDAAARLLFSSLPLNRSQKI